MGAILVTSPAVRAADESAADESAGALMRFYLGTHHPHWLALIDVPLFVSRRRLTGRKTLPVAIGRWALDSGGFTELSMFGKWETSASDYISDVRRFAAEIGGMEWAAPQDWMCEPHIVEKTGLSVHEHQARTVENLLILRMLAPDLPFVPVLQGWTLSDYVRCAALYESAGVDLVGEPLVAIGSVCRRQQLEGGREVVQWFSRQGVKLHAFGMKQTGLKECGWMLASSDSLAWSYQARLSPPLEGCTHKACANCMRYALQWREKLLRTIGPQQPDLGLPL